MTDAIIYNLAAFEELAQLMEAESGDKETLGTRNEETSPHEELKRKTEDGQVGRARGAEAGDRALEAKNDLSGTENGHREREDFDSDEDDESGAA